MNIAGMRVRITIQRNETVIDKYGNHKSAWTDYFTCWASASKGNTKADETVDSKHYRILLYGRIYNIVAVDDQGFRRKSRKFTAELVER